jgi:hypothetical protein
MDGVPTYDLVELRKTQQEMLAKFEAMQALESGEDSDEIQQVNLEVQKQQETKAENITTIVDTGILLEEAATISSSLMFALAEQMRDKPEIVNASHQLTQAIVEIGLREEM